MGGSFATGLGVILTTPARALVSCFVCGFMGRCVRDLSMRGGLSQNWATAVAAAVVALLAVAIVRRQTISPVVLICGVLPLGSTVAVFNVLFDLMRVSSLTGEALSAASVSLSANAGKARTRNPGHCDGARCRRGDRSVRRTRRSRRRVRAIRP